MFWEFVVDAQMPKVLIYLKVHNESISVSLIMFLVQIDQKAGRVRVLLWLSCVGV